MGEGLPELDAAADQGPLAGSYRRGRGDRDAQLFAEGLAQVGCVVGLLVALTALDRWDGRGGAHHAVEERLGAPALDDEVSDLVGVLLVGVAGSADAAGELDPASLLDDVGGLVGREV